MKKLMVVAGVAISALALAAWTITGAKGTGGLVNEAGKRAEFFLDVKKGVNGTQVRLAGTGRFATRIERNGHVGTIRIHLVELRGFQKTNNTAVAEGLGTATVTFGTNSETLRGRIRINVADIRTPNHPEGNDRYAIRFLAANSTTPFEYGGKVVRGDLQVFERTEN